MAWYVFALVDVPPRSPVGRGFAAPISFKRIPGGFAAAERRADVPPIDMGALKQHDAIVTKLWSDVPAILPVRFGTLLEKDELLEMLAEREEDLEDAFAVVRECAQFTWRSLRAIPRGPSAEASRPESGAEYLRRAAGQGTAIPRRYASIRDALRPFVRHERFQPAVAPRPERLYHLVARSDARAYQRSAGEATGREPLALTGPWPPYAFAPEML